MSVKENGIFCLALVLILLLFLGCKKCYWRVISPFSWETAPLCNETCDPEAVQSSSDAGDISGI